VKTCNCRYEAVEAPGAFVAPVIVRREFSWLEALPHGYMEPKTLYRCRDCGQCLYISGAAEPMPLNTITPAQWATYTRAPAWPL
jgi:hypothetical protein